MLVTTTNLLHIRRPQFKKHRAGSMNVDHVSARLHNGTEAASKGTFTQGDPDGREELGDREAVTIVNSPTDDRSVMSLISITSSMAHEPKEPSANAECHPDALSTGGSTTYSSATTSPPTLLQLPGELVKNIASFLDPEWRASFALTCHHLLHVLGTDVLLPTRQHQDRTEINRERRSFLSALVRDYSHLYEFCGVCRSLHPHLEKPSEYVPWCLKSKGRRTLQPSCGERLGVIWLLPGYGDSGKENWIDQHTRSEGVGYVLLRRHVEIALQTSRVEAVTKRVGEVEDLKADNLGFRHPKHGVREVASVSARWLDGKLVLKTERRFSALKAERHMRLWDLFDLRIRICPHQATGNERKPSRRRRIWRRTPDRRGPHEYPDYPYPNLLLSNAIAGELPKPKIKELSVPASLFNCFKREGKVPLPMFCTELNQLENPDRTADTYWYCRSCPTKFRVRWEPNSEELVITVYQRIASGNELNKSGDWIEFTNTSTFWTDFNRLQWDLGTNSEWKSWKPQYMNDFTCEPMEAPEKSETKEEGCTRSRSAVGLKRPRRERIFADFFE